MFQPLPSNRLSQNVQNIMNSTLKLPGNLGLEKKTKMKQTKMKVSALDDSDYD